MDSENEKLLHINNYHVGRDKAERYVKYLAKKTGVPVPKGKNYAKDMYLDFEGKQLKVNFKESILETQNEGSPNILQFLSDSRDQYLAPALTMAAGKPPKGLGLELTSSVGIYSKSTKVPGLLVSPEISLTDDILYFRKMACENSSIKNIQICSRYFRSYLHSCISLIDCFLSRYTNFVKERIEDMDEYTNTSVLGSTSGLEKRINAWFQTFAYHEINNYKTTTEWLYFQKIRTKRNEFVHPSHPITAYSIKEIADYLNYCNLGIGGLLCKFREYTNEEQKIGFIYRIKTAPKITC